MSTDTTSKDTTSEEAGRDYRDTLFLPKTDFPMKAGLPAREPEWLARWEKLDLYRRLRESAKGRETFILHDGPPYANGNIHIGHALNKILKDIVVRSQQMMGKDAAYVPGWDCHGLPIEWQIEEKYRKKGLNKDEVPALEFRRECRDFAQHWVDVQREEFKRLGVSGEWDNPYLTMSFDAEAKIVEEFQKFLMNGSLYRGSKPVMWSVVEKTALAEAEVEYHDHVSHTIWVKFPFAHWASKVQRLDGDKADFDTSMVNEVPALKGASIVIWTTTPWTIPANRAISYSPKIAYGLYEVKATGEKLVLADALAEQVAKDAKIEEWTRLRDVTADELAGVVCKHPFHGQGYDFDVPLLAGDHVTEEAGTGFVHTAPGHGQDDYAIWVENRAALSDVGIETKIPDTVNEEGVYYDHVPLFAGKFVLTRQGKEGNANAAVIEELEKAGALLAKGKLTHSYPHSWRSKAPLIFRNTPQWFVAMDAKIEAAGGKAFRDVALEEIDKVRWVPARNRNRIHSMVEGRPDWVLSRQRAWGVPLTLFVNTKTGELLRDEKVNARIVEAVAKEGADAWFERPASDFLGNDYNEADYERVTDILDVWFDSGSTHAFVLEARGIPWPADLYLEGSDQHRGWFQSSLLESCGTRGRAPYKQVLTHGFTMDEKGRKMSKSLGNVIAPQKIVEQNGADILRLWVANTDYWEDHNIGNDIIKSNVEAYRKLRNTFRYLLGNLEGFTDAERVTIGDMPELERVILHRLAELDDLVRKAYADYDFKRVAHTLSNFMNVELSAFYFDIRKDALYCDAPSAIRRRACRTVLDHLFSCLTAWLAPVLCFTVEEVWLSRFPSETDSVHLRTFPEIPAEWRNEALSEKWKKVRELRRVVTGALEVERREKRIGASLEAAPEVFVSRPDLMEAMKGVDLAEIAITSQAKLTEGEGPADAWRLDDVPGVAVVPKLAEGRKCARSWRILPEVGSDPDYPDLSLRDAAAVREYDAQR
ncbi:MAG: isoleucine--tRNA ligase [Parvibaculum sp.]|jgi:isoleucyl-tRNA synthetase|uniref:isoleucine--tRNA ligase n=1 Tax=Parvibaculum sp. TaxID=2024848 RepID=UPI000C57A5E0|nr:isoleucine--tRNA ligase [Parvibaculum sp.]MAU61673.1 isoleucine--tRNA ligase [Parvibaculum sp.]|tara:strand:+ start:797 stop:3760 length:2964 start_codon:yes stop_codon:yes gene_type:complete